MKWENLREEEFRGVLETSGKLCIMVIGCLEKHGQHLPVGTDSLMGDKITELASEKAGVMMFPTAMWLGDVSCYHAVEHPEKTKSRGFIGIKTETLLTVLEELCDEIARNGFTKILLISSHGGNVPLLRYFTRSQLYKKKNYITIWGKAYNFDELEPENMLKAYKADPDGFSMLTDEDIKSLEKWAETGTGGGHADFRETALIYGTYPDLVAPDRFDAEDGIRTGRFSLPEEFGISATLIDWFANYPNSNSGYAPFGCSKTIGDAAVKMCVDRLVRILKYLKADVSCDEAIKLINER